MVLQKIEKSVDQYNVLFHMDQDALVLYFEEDHPEENKQFENVF